MSHTVPANRISLLLTPVLPSLPLARTVFKAVPELHFIFLIVPSYMSLGKVYATTSCPQTNIGNFMLNMALWGMGIRRVSGS